VRNRAKDSSDRPSSTGRICIEAKGPKGGGSEAGSASSPASDPPSAVSEGSPLKEELGGCSSSRSRASSRPPADTSPAGKGWEIGSPASQSQNGPQPVTRSAMQPARHSASATYRFGIGLPFLEGGSQFTACFLVRNLLHGTGSRPSGSDPPF